MNQLLAALPAGDEIGPGTDRPLVIADVRNVHPLDASEGAEFSSWVKRAPCPVIALSEADSQHSFTGSFDAVLNDGSQVERIVAATVRAPIAAMTFVQTLRTVEGLALEAALTVESLAYGLLQGGAEYREWLASNDRHAAPPDSGPAVLLERDGNVLSVVLNRPTNRNAISREMRDGFVEALDLAVLDDSVEVVKLRGAGKCFSIGGDLGEFGASVDPTSGHWVRSVRSPALAALRCGPKLEANVHGA